MRPIALAAIITSWMVLAAAPAGAAGRETVGVDEHPGAAVPAGLSFRDVDGAQVHWSSLIDRSAPTVLVLAYFRCALLCDQVIASLSRSLPAARVATGQDYRAVVVSFDPRDTPGDAVEKERTVLGTLPAFERARWRFAVDDDGSAAQLAAAVGFRYRFDRASDQYAHPAVAILLSPSGRISRYLYGAAFAPEVLAPALRDAAGGRARASVERILLTCFHYVPSLRAHAAAVAWVLRGGTSALFIALAGTLVILVRRQRAGEGHGA